MDQKTLYQYIKLGMNLEYLNGIGTNSILLATSMVGFPNLNANLPGTRYPVKKVIEVIASLLQQFKDLGLEKSLAAAAPLQPMLQEMQQFMSQVPPEQQPGISLLDPFADRIVANVRQLLVVVRGETGEKAAADDAAAAAEE
jgi:hypothetical protein